MATCNPYQQNTGSPVCINKMKTIFKPVLVPANFEIADEATAAAMATWITAFNEPLVSNRVYPFPKIEQSDPVREDYEIAEGLHTKFPLQFGDNGENFQWWGVPFCQLRNLYSFADTAMNIVYIDSAGQIIMRKPKGQDKCYGFDISTLIISAPSFPTNDQPVSCSVQFDYVYPEQLFDATVIIPEAGFGAKEVFEGLYDITVTAAAVTNATATITYVSDCGGDASALGLIITPTSNIALYNNSTSSVITPTSFTDNLDGTYLLTYPTASTGDEIQITTSKDGYDFGTPATWQQPA